MALYNNKLDNVKANTEILGVGVTTMVPDSTNKETSMETNIASKTTMAKESQGLNHRSVADEFNCISGGVALGQNDVLVCLSSEGVGMGMPHQ